MADKDWQALMTALRSTLMDRAPARSRAEIAEAPDLVELRRAKIVQEIRDAENLTLDLDMTDETFWRHVCTKPFYAHRKVNEIRALEGKMQAALGDYRELLGAEWNSDRGEKFSAFLNNVRKEGDKLAKVVQAARNLAATKSGDKQLTFMRWLITGTKGPFDPASWEGRRQIYQKLNGCLDFGQVTVFHAMMELGFAVVKPDQVLNRLVSRMGIMTDYEVCDRRTNSRKWVLLDPRMSADKAASLGQIDHFNWSLQRRMAEISEATGIPMRALDIIIVKLGQTDDEANGYARTVCGDPPTCQICTAKPLCDFGRAKKSSKTAAHKLLAA